MAERLLSITIDGTPCQVVTFTTVAAAVALHGGHVNRRSVGGQPRAALCGMGICQECRLTVDGLPHVLGCQTLCRDGMRVETLRETLR